MHKNISIKTIYFVFVLSCLPVWMNAQVFLQIEEQNKVETVKFYPGQKLSFQLKAYDKTWERGVITDINPLLNAVFIDDGMYELDEFSAIKTAGSYGGRALGTLFQTFGYSYIIYGIIVAIGGNGITGADIAIASVATGVGWLFRWVFKKKVYKLGEMKSLRIIDARMFVPEQELN